MRLRLTTLLGSGSLAVVGLVGLAGCANQVDELEEQLERAGYTSVSAAADYDRKYDSKTKKTKKVLDDYEATAWTGSCRVEVEQDPNSDDYTVERVNGTPVDAARTRNLTAAALSAYVLEAKGIRC